MASKRKKVLFITDGVIIFVVCALIIALLLNIQALKPRIEEAASDVLGMEVLIKGRLGIDLFPGIGISLREISVRNKGTDVITVEVMKVGLEFIALTRREIRINRTGLIKPVFSLSGIKTGHTMLKNRNVRRRKGPLPWKRYPSRRVNLFILMKCPVQGSG